MLGVAVVGGASGGVIELDADALLDAAPDPLLPGRRHRRSHRGGRPDRARLSAPVAGATRRPTAAGTPMGRIVRHVDVWSVFKVALLLHLSASW